ncbi:hypothetical protein O181_126530 [Austropuccinia psidii MF-1]|uniref:Uncharacterized protein n=1 Tax=Austropuccinia psidii MF-1 TaxID=1389203 RepID=A0A9Q3KRJ2_9BASI|nr:hypothetical protein [Austropuccinia psidii MF-1]
MNSYFYIKSFLGQEKTIELLGGWSLFSCKDKAKKIKNWLKNQSLLAIDQKKELEMTPAFGRWPSGVNQVQKNAKRIPKDLRRIRTVPKTIRERAKEKQNGTDLTHSSTGSPNWSLQPWTVSSIWPGLLWNSQPKSRKG